VRARLGRPLRHTRREQQRGEPRQRLRSSPATARARPGQLDDKADRLSHYRRIGRSSVAANPQASKTGAGFIYMEGWYYYKKDI
jgi:hypothetical protein